MMDNNCEEENTANQLKSESCEATDELSEGHVDHAVEEFNKSRKIIIKNVPPVTYDEVKDYMGRFAVSNISISKKFRHAIVTMLHGEEAEEAVQELQSKPTLLDTEVQVELYHNENLLCVTHLPFNITQESFEAEMKPYGTIEKCFLMKFHDTGKSKGYGFVEFVHNKEKSEEACQQLNGRRMGSCILQCNFVDASVVSFEQLHSCTLLVDHLPIDYNDFSELRQLCSGVAEPVYCKLGEKNERRLGFGLVQYATYQQAEQTQLLINGHKLSSHSIRVTFCIPGKCPDELYEEIAGIRYQRLMALKTPPPPLMSLPEIAPPIINPENITSPVIKRLLAQSNAALTNFSQVLNLLQLDIMKQQMSLRPGLLGMAPSLPASPLMNPDLQIALLAVLLAQQIQLNQPRFVNNPVTQQYILRSLDSQQQFGLQGSARPSLLGNPYIAQANTLLSSINPDDTKNEAKQSEAMKSTETAQPESAEAHQGQGLTLFPQSDLELNTNILTNFSQLLTTLNTPPSKPKSAGARLPSAVSGKRDDKLNERSDAKTLPSDAQNDTKRQDSETATSDKNDTKNEDMEAGESEIKTDAIEQKEGVEVKQEGEGNVAGNTDKNGTLGAKKEEENRNKIRPLMGDPSSDPSSASNNPFFHIPGVGLANPFLATFIEQQIRNHLQTMQQINLFSAAMQLQSQQQQQQQQQQKGGRQGQSTNIPPLMGSLSTPGSGILGPVPAASGSGILGAPPQTQPPSLLGTPTSWNRYQKSSSSTGQRIPEKRTLNFDDSQPEKSSAYDTNDDDTSGGSILGAPPGPGFQTRSKGNSGGTWEGFCKTLTRGKNDGPTSAKRVKPLMQTDDQYTGGEWSHGQYGDYSGWGGDWSGYSQADYAYNTQQYSQYSEQYNSSYQQYEGAYSDYWDQYGSSISDKTQQTTDDAKNGQNYGDYDYDQYAYNQWQYGYGWGGSYGHQNYGYGSVQPAGSESGSYGDYGSQAFDSSTEAYSTETKKKSESAEPRYNTQYYKQKSSHQSGFESMDQTRDQTLSFRDGRARDQSTVNNLSNNQSYSAMSSGQAGSQHQSSLIGQMPSLMDTSCPQRGAAFGTSRFGKSGTLSAKPVRYDATQDDAQPLVGGDQGTAQSYGAQPLYGQAAGGQQGYGDYEGMEASDAGLMPPPSNSYVQRTPAQQSRESVHLLPSPEASPDNGYIGQHSQGIGGHYADSYKVKY